MTTLPIPFKHDWQHGPRPNYEGPVSPPIPPAPVTDTLSDDPETRATQLAARKVLAICSELGGTSRDHIAYLRRDLAREVADLDAERAPALADFNSADAIVTKAEAAHRDAHTIGAQTEQALVAAEQETGHNRRELERLYPQRHDNPDIAAIVSKLRPLAMKADDAMKLITRRRGEQERAYNERGEARKFLAYVDRQQAERRGRQAAQKKKLDAAEARIEAVWRELVP